MFLDISELGLLPDIQQITLYLQLSWSHDKNGHDLHDSVYVDQPMSWVSLADSLAYLHAPSLGQIGRR